MGQRASYDDLSHEQLVQRLTNLLTADQETCDALRTETSAKFLAAMISAMLVSFFKYGAVADGFPERLNAIGRATALTPEQFDNLGSFGKRLKWYFFGDPNPYFGTAPDEPQYFVPPGNTEYLVDAANFLMIEFMHPAHLVAHFKATDNTGSPGRVAQATALYDQAVHYTNRDILEAQ